MLGQGWSSAEVTFLSFRSAWLALRKGHLQPSEALKISSRHKGLHRFSWWFLSDQPRGCNLLDDHNFHLSLDSWISFLPLGFSPTLKEKTENPKVRKEMESRLAVKESLLV